MLGNIVFFDRTDSHILRLVGISIRHIKEEAAIGKVQGTGCRTGRTGPGLAQGFTEWFDSRNGIVHAQRHLGLSIVTQQNFARSTGKGHRIATHIVGTRQWVPTTILETLWQQGNSNLFGNQQTAIWICTRLDSDLFRIAGQRLTRILQLEMIYLNAYLS